ncbi:MAG: hypothetical protein CMJ84_08535 [Planctomycetes bacterium]|nr:hypothetical protein [Planctomycetota bacterium]
MRGLTRLVASGSIAAGLSAPAWTQITAEPLVSISTPVVIDAPRGDSQRLFIGTKGGRIWIVRDGQIVAPVFLDLSDLVSDNSEQGLLGLAFHPSHYANGIFYVSYTDLAGSSVVRVYRVFPSDPDRGDPNSFTNILGPISQPYANHNGGCIRISAADLKLYVGLGDGGLGNDPGNRAQDGQSLLGKLLRLELDGSIPADNPFVGQPAVRDEVWALGLRNPWRFSFDRETNDLWIADVGQSTREEINFEPAGQGRHNYGWRCTEGTVCTGLGGCTCASPGLTAPVFEYSHAEGCSIIGGFRYRGQQIPAFQGRYVFGDFCAGRVWSLAFDGNVATDLVEHTAELNLPPSASLFTFGEDGVGELHMGLISSDGPAVWSLVPGCVGTSHHFCDTTPNSSGTGAMMGSNSETSISENLFEIRAFGAVPAEAALFFYGPNETQMPFGEGFRCVGGGVFRLDPPIPVGAGGQLARPVDFTAPPANVGPGRILAGDTWKFQLWYRDPAGGPAGFNLSDGLSVDFCP